MSRQYCFVAFVLCVPAVSLAQPAPASAYPNRPLRIIVPFPAAGPTDIVARLIGIKMSERLGQNVIVDNRAGAGGTIGAEIATRSAPDGYTLLMGSTANMAVNVSLYQKLSYDPVRDFQPINLAAVTPNLLVVSPNFPGNTLKSLIEIAKAKSGTVNYASGGVGTPSHLAAELFKTMAGVQMNHVPYKGSIPALTDVMSGQVTLMFDSMASALPFARSGKLKALAQTGSKRSSAVPEIQTVAEGGLPGYEVVGWFGFFAPAKTPRPIVNKLSREISEILALPDVKERYAALGIEPGPADPDVFAAFLKNEIAKWGKVIRDSGAKADQ